MRFTAIPAILFLASSALGASVPRADARDISLAANALVKAGVVGCALPSAGIDLALDVKAGVMVDATKISAAVTASAALCVDIVAKLHAELLASADFKAMFGVKVIAPNAYHDAFYAAAIAVGLSADIAAAGATAALQACTSLHAGATAADYSQAISTVLSIVVARYDIKVVDVRAFIKVFLGAYISKASSSCGCH